MSDWTASGAAHTDDVDRAIGTLAPDYRDLFDRISDAVRADERFRALWLSGSLAKGTADIGSDLDLLVAVADAAHGEFASSWREWLDLVSPRPVLIARELPHAPGSFFSTNVDCLRLDVVVEPVSGLADSPHRHRLVVFDRDGLDVTVPKPVEPAGPDLQRITSMVEEAFRVAAIFPQAVVGREDWLLGVVGIEGYRRQLYDLFVESNQPLPPMGVKQFSAKLTADQRDTLLALPPVAPTRESTIAGMNATLDAWLTAGRAAVESVGGQWPTELAETVTAYVRRNGVR